MRLAVALFLSLMFFFAGVGDAADAKSPSLWRTRKNLTETRNKEKKLVEQTRQKARQEQKTLAELMDLDKRLADLRSELKSYQDEIDSAAAQEQATRRQQRMTSNEMQDSKDRLGAYLRAWRQGDPEGPQSRIALMCATAEAERLSNARLSKFHLRRRADILQEYRSRQERLRRNKARKTREIEALKSQRKNFLGRIRKDKKRTEHLLAETRASRRQFEELVGSILERQQREARARDARRASPRAASFAGRLVRPVQGRLTRKYGRQRHKEFNATLYSSGIEISARRGVPVRAAASGRVVHRGWLKGYGRVMIVDHGSDLYTVYGHLQEFRVKDKQSVKQGMVIGTVGDTGSLGGVSLYFEVRVKGQAKDPQLYLQERYS